MHIREDHKTNHAPSAGSLDIFISNLFIQDKKCEIIFQGYIIMCFLVAIYFDLFPDPYLSSKIDLLTSKLLISGK